MTDKHHLSSQMREHGSYLILLGNALCDMADHLDAEVEHLMLNTNGQAPPVLPGVEHPGRTPFKYDYQFYLAPGLNHDKILQDAYAVASTGRIVLVHGHRQGERCEEQCWEMSAELLEDCLSPTAEITPL
jgi:hypothetical protein